MAMKKCKECKSSVRSKAMECPQCGAVLKSETGVIAWNAAFYILPIAIGVIYLVGFFMVLGN